MISDSYESRVLSAVEKISRPRRPWMPPGHSGDPYQVVIIGGGQAGLALSMALRLDNIGGVLCLDEAEEGKAGVWCDFARMKQLRTPKTACGMDLGVPDLTAESWYREKFGDAAWEGLTYIPREHWAHYLEWYRETLGLPVSFASKVEEIIPAENGLFRLRVKEASGVREIESRRVVLANGIAGSGAWTIPGSIRTALSRHLYRHTAEPIDFAALAGKNFAVLGAGASAFDNAICATDAGASKVHLFCRRPAIGKVNTQEWAASTGFLKHYSGLEDQEKWRFMSRMFEVGQLPSVNSYRLATANVNFSMFTGEDDLQIEEKGGGVRIKGKFGVEDYALLIVGTGFRTNLRVRPELKHFVEDILTWNDRGVVNPHRPWEAEMGHYPYLAEDFSFRSLSGRQRPWLSRIFCYNYGAMVSNGLSGASITGLKYSLPKIVHGIGAQIYQENLSQHFDSLVNYPEDAF